MNAAPARPDADSLLSRDLPDNLDRRRAIDDVDDIDVSHPARRSSDEKAMANALAVAALSQSRRQYLADPERITAMGDL